MKKAIALFGRESNSTPELEKMAYEIGAEIAKAGAVLINGGRAGTMKAASKGAKDNKGFVVGLLPGADKSDANDFVDVAIPTGLDAARGILIARAADAVIMLGGGNGTLSEVCNAYAIFKPIVAIEGSGGWADKIVGTYIDEKKKVLIRGAKTAKDAVALALKLAEESKCQPTRK